MTLTNNNSKNRLVALMGTAAISLLVASIGITGAAQLSYQQVPPIIARGFVTSAMIADNTIVSADLRDGEAVRSVDIVDGEVNTDDLANNAVTSDKIEDGEVKAEDLDPSIDIGGGETPGFSLQVTERSNSITTPNTEGVYTVSVQCNPDEVVTGGGFSSNVIGGGVSLGDHLMESKKQDNGWSVTLYIASAFDLTVYAECLKIVPAAE